MITKTPEHHCIIVGGGIAGLMAATLLQKKGIRVTLLDKGRGIGGRMATRRMNHETFGEGVFDYGAQYFTARDERFQKLVQEWIENGVVRQWAIGFYTEKGILKTDDTPRYIGCKGMRGITKHLARNLTTFPQTEVTGLKLRDQQWEVSTGQNDTFVADSLLLTPPLSQTLNLLDVSGITLPSDSHYQQLRTIEYLSCIALLVMLESTSRIPEPGGLWGSGNPLQWIADNQKKGISPHAAAVTIHADPNFSKAHWQSDEDVVAEQLLQASSEWIDTDTVVQYQVHRWRYSLSNVSGTRPVAVIDSAAPLILAGDGFTAGRVEGAAVSGMSAAEELLRILKKA